MLNISEIDYSYSQYIMFVFMKKYTSTPVHICECYSLSCTKVRLHISCKGDAQFISKNYGTMLKRSDIATTPSNIN